MNFLVRKNRDKASGTIISQEKMQYLLTEILSLLSKAKPFYNFPSTVNLAEHFEY